MAHAPRNVPDRDGVVELADGRVLGYAEYGPLDGRVVLWFHGTPGACRQVPPDAPDLARERGVRLIGIERPGTGRSTTRRYAHVLDWALDVEQFVDAQGIGRVRGGRAVGRRSVRVGVCRAHARPSRGRRRARRRRTDPGRRVRPGLHPHLASVRADSVAHVRAGRRDLLRWCLRPLAVVAASPAFDIYAHYIAPECDRAVLDRPDMKEAFLYDLTLAARTGVRSARARPGAVRSRLGLPAGRSSKSRSGSGTAMPTRSCRSVMASIRPRSSPTASSRGARWWPLLGLRDRRARSSTRCSALWPEELDQASA